MAFCSITRQQLHRAVDWRVYVIIQISVYYIQGSGRLYVRMYDATGQVSQLVEELCSRQSETLAYCWYYAEDNGNSCASRLAVRHQ